MDQTRGEGLIPAHAGKTTRGHGGPYRPAAHPRSRGENGCGCGCGCGGGVGGSSPLTRGKHLPKPRRSATQRLIPAHAGKTRVPARGRAPVAAHPRSRGENRTQACQGSGTSGSSPLTRGKHLATDTLPGDGGLIPAHAGKTPGPRGPYGHWRGSSPLTRGKLLSIIMAALTPRLIPAHAGKTLPDLRFYCADRSDLGNP